jgi:putative peptide zinc metalloprotease protein
MFPKKMSSPEVKGAASEFDIAIHVKPELPWLQSVEVVACSYLTVRAFPRKLIEQISEAIGEAAEQLTAVCIERDVVTPFEVGFAWQDEVLQVHFVYGASIPLNPHQELDYEVPSVGKDSDSDDTLAGLWLHIVKRTMDRVFFRVDGKRASLVMMKYCRAEWQSRQLWVMSLTPRLRADLAIEHQAVKAGLPQSGDSIIHDTRGQKVLKLSPSDTFILSRLDGKKTLEEIYLEHSVELGPISPEHVKRLYETLEAAGMLEGIFGEEQGKARWERWLSPTFSIPRPDAAVTWVYRHTRFMFHPLGVSALVLIGFSGLIPLFANRHAIASTFQHIDALFLQFPLMIVLAYFFMFVDVALHEFAHGATCKHFGGRIRKLGIMWYLAMFIFFCDTTSAWTFPKKSQRIWVSLAGPLVSWAFFGVTAWCAGLTAASGSPWAVLWIVLTFMYAFSLVMNFNPLIRMDAYYMLMDWTEIPNLQKKSFDYLKAVILGWARRPRTTAEPAPSAREKRIFVAYGVLSAIMSFVFIVLPFWRLADLWLAHRHFTVWGVMTLIVVALVIGGMLFNAHALIHAARHREYKIL